MSAPSFTFVSADDWAGLYVNGELVMQGHSLELQEVVEMVAHVGGVGVNFEHWDSDKAYEVIQGHGECPDDMGEFFD